MSDDFAGALTFLRPVLPPIPNPSWAETFGNAALLSPYVQGMQAMRESANPRDPDYNPFEADEIKGFENYARWFVDVGSRAEADALKARIRDNERRRQVVEEGSWSASFLADALLDPVNYLPLPISRGIAAGRAALLSGAAVGAGTALTEGVRLNSDPTATFAEAAGAVVFSSLFGGALGAIGARLSHTEIDRASRLLDAELSRLPNDAPPPVTPGRGQAAPSPAGELPSPPAGEARVSADPGFVARTTEGDAGLAPAPLGLERLSAWFGASTAGRLLNSPYRSVNDFVARVVGEYEMMTKANLAGKPSERSAMLQAGLWKGAAYDSLVAIDDAWGRYISGGGKASRAALMAQRVADTFRRTRPDGKMTFKEFNEAVFRAHKSDRIESDNPFVAEAAKAARAVFDRARDEGAKTGFLRTAEGQRRKFVAATDRARKLAGELRAIETKADRTANDGVVLRETQREFARVLGQIEEWADRGFASDEQLAKIIEDINARTAKKAEAARDLAERIEITIAARAEKDRETLRALTAREAERGLTPNERLYKELLLARQGERAEIDAANLPAEMGGVEIAYGPTGKLREDGSPVHAYLDREANVVRVDVEGLRGQWAEKPWLDPKLPGVKPLPDDLFPTPEAWVEFVIRHELAHTRAGRPMGTGWIEGVGEDAPAGAKGQRQFTDANKADYENRINAIAVAEMREPGPTPKQAAALDGLRATAENPATPRQQAYVKDMTDRLNRNAIVFPENPAEKFYLPHIFRYDKIHANPDGLVAVLATKLPEDEARNIVASMLKGFDPETGLAPPGFVGSSSGYSRFNMARKLREFSSDELADFLETDMSTLVRVYADRFGRSNEFARAFGGDPMGEGAIADVLIQAARESKGGNERAIADELAALRSDLEFVRDSGLGTVHDPALRNQRTVVATARNAGSLMMGGTFGISAMTEMARPMMVHGIGRTFGFAFNGMALALDRVGEVSAQLRSFTGEATDTVLNTAVRHIAQGGDAGPTSSRALDSFNRFAEGAWYVVNLLAPVTDMLKRWNLVMSNQFMLEDLAKLARSGDEALTGRLASYGLSADDARRIMAQPIDRSSNVWMPNLQAWDDPDLVLRYTSAISGVVRRTIITPGQMDGPDITRGFIGGSKKREFALATLPFQFMQYSFAATNRLLISGLQGRDASFMAGMIPMVMMGMVVAWAKSSSQEWGAISLEEKLIRAVDQSGVLPIISDLNTMAENASQGTVGLRPSLGLPTRNRDPDAFDSVGEFAGPVGGKVADIMRLFMDGDTDGADVARTIRRSLPFNNLFYLRDLFRGAERMGAAALE